MKSLLNFIFRGKLYSCNVYVGNGEGVSRMYVILLDKDVISEFGDEITINPDLIRKLNKGIEQHGETELHEAIFKAAQFHPDFLFTKAKKVSPVLKSSVENEKALRLHQPYTFARPAGE